MTGIYLLFSILTQFNSADFQAFTNGVNEALSLPSREISINLSGQNNLFVGSPLYVGTTQIGSVVQIDQQTNQNYSVKALVHGVAAKALQADSIALQSVSESEDKDGRVVASLNIISDFSDLTKPLSATDEIDGFASYERFWNAS